MTKESKQDLIIWFINDIISQIDKTIEEVNTGKYKDYEWTAKEGIYEFELQYTRDKLSRQLFKNGLFDLDNIEEDSENG